MDESGQGEGGGQKSRKFGGRHMYMAPYVSSPAGQSQGPIRPVLLPSCGGGGGGEMIEVAPVDTFT